jgi:phosphate uptake regulator
LPIVRRAFDALYKRGYDEVTVKFSSKEALKDIEIAINNEAMTFEIIKQEKNTCIVKNLTEASEQEYDSVFRRVFLLLKVMGEDLLIALKNKDFETIENIKSLEKTNNKLTHYLRRSLNKKGYKEFEKTSLVYTIVEQLETIADEFKFLCDFLKDKRNYSLSISEETFSLFENLNKSLSVFSNLFFDFNERKVVELYKLKEELVNRGLELFHTKKSKEVILIHYLINIEKMIFDLVGPILATNL